MKGEVEIRGTYPGRIENEHHQAGIQGKDIEECRPVRPSVRQVHPEAGRGGRGYLPRHPHLPELRPGRGEAEGDGHLAVPEVRVQVRRRCVRPPDPYLPDRPAIHREAAGPGGVGPECPEYTSAPGASTRS